MNEQELKDLHDDAKRNFDLSYENGDMIREKIREARRFAIVPGAQWEGSTDGNYDFEGKFDKYPRFELNKVAKECERINSEYRNNRITARFRPKDSEASEELAEKLNGKFRADYEESSGQEAFDNAFADAVYGGMGCWRLDVELEDEYDPMNEDQRIVFKPVYDPESCVWFDQNSKEYDRSDAHWAIELFSMTPDEFKRQYPDAELSSLDVSTDSQQYDWSTPDSVYIGRYYCKKIEDTELISYKHPMTGEVATYEEFHIDKVIDELEESGFEEVARRKVKMPRIYCGLMTGQEWLEEPEVIPGQHIPLIPMYGRRWFVDNQERIEGHVQKAMDAQRLENLMVSMMADNATQAGGDNIPVINIDGMPQELASMWGERNTKRPGFLPVTSVLDSNGNPTSLNPLVGNTGVTNMSPALAGLLQYTGQAIQQITGSNIMEKIPSNIATDTVDSIFNRMDTQSFIYMDNMAKSIRRCAVVYLSMLRDIQGTETEVRIVNEDGSDDMATMSGEVVDRKTGEVVALVDLSKGRYEVSVDVGKSFATRRDATVRQLTEIIQGIPPQHPYYNILMSMIIDNMDGEGIDDLKEYNREQMLLQGVAKPRNEEEEAMIAQAKQAQAQQQDPNMVLAMAEQQKAQNESVSAQAKMIDSQTKAFTAQVSAQESQSKTVLNYVKAEEINEKKIREAIDLIRGLSNDQIENAIKQQSSMSQKVQQ